MKHINLFALLFSISFGYAQTMLSAGDIAITGFNSDNPDQFTFVLLTDVLNTTQIKFTDNGWQSSGSFRPGEGIIIWTATSDLTCGTEITITDNSPYSSSIGTITDDNQFALATNGDHILAYQGADASPTFIYAIHFGSGTGWTDATTPQTSAVPSGLVDTVNALYAGNVDNGNYDCSVTIDSSLILAAVSTAANWNGSDTRLTSLGGCAYSCSPCTSTAIWDGVAWSNGTGPTAVITARISGDYNTSVATPSFTACSLTVDSGFTLTVDENYTIEVENDVTNNGNISVLTNGSFVQNNDLATFTNSVNDNSTVTKLTAPIDAWYEYTYWSSPVQGELMQDTFFGTNTDRRYLYNSENFKDSFAESMNNNDTTTPGQDDIDDDANDWQLYTSGVMQPGIGYACTLSVISFNFGGGAGAQFGHIFAGPFNNGVYNVPVYRNDAEMADTNWNFIGNPYPSAISVDDFFTLNAYDATTNPTGTIEGAIYLWSQDTAPSSTFNGNSALNFDNSDYAIINIVGSTGALEVAGGDTVLPARYIPSGQGFFVSYDNNGASSSSTVNGDGDTITTGEVLFNNSLRVSGNNDQFFKNDNSQNSTNNKLWLEFTSDDGIYGQVLVGYVPNATNGDDGMSYDAVKNISTGYSAFMYSTIEESNKKFGIQGKEISSLTIDEEIPLGLYTTITEPTLYKISILQFEGDFFNNNTVYLEDSLMNTVHNLSDSDYTFTSASGEFNDRFKVVFNTNTLSTNGFETNESNLSIIELQNDNVQFVFNGDLTIKSVKIIDTSGRELYNFSANTSKAIFNLSNMSHMVYIAQIELSNGLIINKKALKK